MNRVLRIKSLFLLIAFGVVALAAIGLGRVVWEDRQARLDETLRALSAGLERLNEADTAAAEQFFKRSIDTLRDLGRDPLFALHHLFAARVTAGPEGLQEVRGFSLPEVRDGETLLAVALSQDSTLLAAITPQRLLCAPVESGRWVQRELPGRIDRAAGLHVDSETGKAHAVVADDGRLLTADCFAPGSPINIAPSATGNAPAVAWLDPEAGRAWVAPAHPQGSELTITARPLPGGEGEPIELHVAFPGEVNTLFAKPAIVHSMGRVADNLLLFYGDANLEQDSDLRDESVLVIAVDDPARQANRLVFPAFIDGEEGGKARWRSTHVRRLLPASAPGRVYVLTEGPAGVAILGSDAKPIDVQTNALFASEHGDGREIYELCVTSSDEGVFTQIRHRRTGAHLKYPLPWQFSERPELAVISHDGRRTLVASRAGHMLLMDLSRLPALAGE
ncbi:MAG: hypothetical protein IRZ28_19590 [Steroidobacteraceae bacterium]|nr:hypothetical protein [Steroidobacteraceae bacterium]